MGLPWVWAAERHSGGGLCLRQGCEAVSAAPKANLIKATHTGERARRGGSHVDSPRGTKLFCNGDKKWVTLIRLPRWNVSRAAWAQLRTGRACLGGQLSYRIQCQGHSLKKNPKPSIDLNRIPRGSG